MPKYHDLKSSQNDKAIMDRILRYLAKEEGFVAKPTLDPNKKQYNIGYGSKIDSSKPGWQKQTITREAASERLKDDYLRHRNYATEALKDAGYANPSGRVLDGLGLLFFNTSWGNLADSQRFRNAAKIAARGDEDALVSYAKSIDTIGGEHSPLIAARRAKEAAYMKGGQIGDSVPYRPTIKPSKPQPVATPTAKPTETIPGELAGKKEGLSIWDRIKGYAEDASDAVLGTNYGPQKREAEYLDKYRKASKPDAKPTPSTPIAAREADEPGVKTVTSGEDEEARQRETANTVRDMVLDPQVLNEITKKDSEGQSEDIGQEIMKRIWIAKNPDKPVPETITEEDLQLSQPVQSDKIGSPWAPELAPKQRALDEMMGRTRATLRKRASQSGGMQRPATSPGDSAAQ